MAKSGIAVKTEGGVAVQAEGKDPPSTGTAVVKAPSSDPAVSAEVNRLVKLVRALPASSRAASGGSKRVWQIVSLPLRVWATDPATGAVIRPFYMLALELYPSGSVSACGRVRERPAEHPPPLELLRFALASMAEPAGDNGPRVRPDVVTFLDEATTALATPPLAAAGMEAQTLTLAEGVSEYVASLSNKMVEKDTAAVGDVSGHPGLLRSPGVTVDVLRSMHASAAAMAAARPWRYLPERLALRVTALDGRVYFVSVFGSDGDATGFVAAPSLVALQAKFTRATGMGTPVLADGVEVPSVYGGEVVLCAACGRRLAEKGRPRPRPPCAGATGRSADGAAAGDDGVSGTPVNRCSRCHAVYYCGRPCQVRDWAARHHAECTDAEAGPRLAARPEGVWVRRELALILCDPTAVPFDDLDAIAEHGLGGMAGDPDKPKPDAGGVLYPVPFVTVAGAGAGGGGGGAAGSDAAGLTAKPGVERPGLQELELLDAVARALAEVTEPPARGVEVAAHGLRFCTERDMSAPPPPLAVEEIDVTGS
ncbi:hypothetical protein BU14_1650s0002 [Porphyra umbilicalis]|uniref:MYND-type domain-containing protein n=1 Tax=Porphyra umbilicalis TaxID=2786 RepID=A0A1X6NLF1_PORUM|nr:hypothetical protein BU14_1650s0002 [Porphyra umbilicalis]|eukprot:OSX69296.1 hypothetical protein BU14_1650s0002 [Porphyra umbilicalis]